jgi:addiction module antidote protein, HigA family
MREFAVTERPKRAPTHPGVVLREDVLPAMNETVTGFARRIGMSRQTVHDILAGRRSITPEAALRIGTVVGNGARVWMNMQVEYDLWRARQALRDELKAIAA